MTDKPNPTAWTLLAVLAGATLLYIASLGSDNFGYYHDDGIYVVTAKALATSQGYRIISLPYEPAQTKYPPFYPILLSFVWRVDPQFPQNLFPMMWLSIVATVTFLTLTWFYLVKKIHASGWHVLLIVTLTAINWRTIILATNIYSEMVYSALSLGALWLAEGDEAKQKSWFREVCLGVILGFAFLTRTAGISLMMAVISFYLLRRQFSRASLVFVVGGSFIVAWIAWCAMSEIKIEGISVPYYTSYRQDFIKRVGTFETLLETVGINAFMLLLTSIPLTILGIDYVPAQSFVEQNLILITLVFLVLVRGFIRHMAAGFHLLDIYLLFYLGLHLLWPFTSYDRFLAPLLAFLLFFLTTEVKSIAHLMGKELTSTTARQMRRKVSAAVIGVFLLVVVGVGSYNYALGFYRSIAPNEIFAKRRSEDRQVFQWIIANTDPSAVLICYRDPQYYLYTGRKAVRSFLYTGGKAMPSFTSISASQDQIDEPEKIILRIIKESGGQYLILTSSDFEQEYETELIRKTFDTLIKDFPETFIPQFQSADGRTAIYYIQRRGSHVIGS